MGSGRGSAESIRRAVVTLFFMFTMFGSLVVSSGPLFVSVADVTVMLFLSCSSCGLSAWDLKAYSFKSSLVDIPILSLVRSAIVICAYSLCSSPSSYRPYIGLTVVNGIATASFVTVKASMFSLNSMKNTWSVPLLLLPSLAFGFAHIIIAQRARYHASRKLLFRWEDVESGIVGKEHHQKSYSPKKTARKYNKRRDNDLPASSLADADSLFMDCNGIRVHYKLVDGCTNFQKSQELASSPSNIPIDQVLSGCNEILGSRRGSEANVKNGVVLIHGFGGGVFSWRHVMYPLARQTRSTVVAFDRPGFGLTSRPSRSEWQQKHIPNPYELQSQVDLLFALCERLHLRSVVLVGHDDGGLLALMAAAKAFKSTNTCKVAVKGVVLVGVSLSREVVPTFERILLQTPVGRQMLRPIIRSGIGQVANKRAWHDTSKLTADVLELYKAPLRVEGWEQALAEVTKTSRLQSRSAAELLQAVSNLPALLVAGLQDMLVPLQAAQSLATKLPQSKFVGIPGCGHMPPEECPGALLAAMLPFILSIFDE